MFRSLVATLAIAPLFLLTPGCASADSNLIGVWTPDTAASSIPTVPVPNMDRNIKAAMATTMLKLRSDRTFLLASGPTKSTEGKWSIQAQTLTLTPHKGSFEGPFAFFGAEIKATLRPDRKGISFEQETPFGPAKVVFRKSA